MITNELSYSKTPSKKIPDGVLGILFLLCTEIMFFAGLISAYIIGRAGEVAWPPLDQPRLPVLVTFVNTLVLLSSGIAAWIFYKNYKRNIHFRHTQSLQLLMLAVFLGLVFLIVQGAEWARLISFGLTSTSSLYGAFFYVIIGSHAVHAFGGIVALIYLHSFLRSKMFSGRENALTKIRVCLIYWYFVVCIWPFLYYMVYLL